MGEYLLVSRSSNYKTNGVVASTKFQSPVLRMTGLEAIICLSDYFPASGSGMELFPRVCVGDGIKYYLCPVLARSWQTLNICRQPGPGRGDARPDNLGNSGELNIICRQKQEICSY